jgi:FMN-dependent NADH-azoreductase
MKLLHIDSSVLGDNSVSRSLTAGIVAQQKALHPGLEVTYLDLAQQPLQHLSPAHIGHVRPPAG